MSHTILYDSVGIKFKKDNLYLTLSKQGCNNVYTSNRKRSRDWTFWSPLGCKPFKKETLIEYLEAERLRTIDHNNKDKESYPGWSDYTDKSYGWFTAVAVYGKSCSTTSYKQYYNHYVKEDSKCVWFEDFAKAYSVYVDVPYYAIPDNLRDTVFPKRRYVKTEEELFEAIEYFSLNFIGCSFYINTLLEEYETSKDVLRRLNPDAIPQRVKSTKTKIEVEKFYTIMFDGNYFKKRTVRSIYCSFISPQIKLATEKQALARLNKVSKGDGRFSIKVVNEKAMV